MTSQAIKAIVKYIVWILQEGEWALGKTKVVKLLYLVDVDYFRAYRQTLTGFTWRYYYYGPYANEIEDVFKRLSLDLPQEEVKTTKGHRAFVFRSSEEAEWEFNEAVPKEARCAVERVLRGWAREELNPLLSYVYFDTEPMANASPGDVLDFECIAPEASAEKVDEAIVQLTSTERERLTQRFDNYKHRQAFLAELTKMCAKKLPSPRSRAYLDAKAMMDEEERPPLPVNIDVIVGQ